jgi:hypothetical protein
MNFQDFKIYFYNNYHNGDVFYSKEFVRDIKNKIGKSHYYIHNNDFSILKDFDIDQIRSVTPDNQSSLSKRNNNELYINTWIGQYGAKYLKYDCSLKSNYLMYCDIYKTLDINIEPIGFYIPTVDFDKVNKVDFDKKCVLVCNNNVHSDQSENFNFDPIIDELSNTYKDLLFIMTNDTQLSKENTTIINDMNNLLEISYISTQTDIIIGRGSGPYCFSHIQDNMKNPNKTFIALTYKENEGKWVPDSESQAKQYWSNNFNTNNIIAYIENIIKYNI